MIVNTLKKCCETCGTPDIEVEDRSYFIDKKNIYIYCNHDKVCYKYNKSEEKEET